MKFVAVFSVVKSLKLRYLMIYCCCETYHGNSFVHSFISDCTKKMCKWRTIQMKFSIMNILCRNSMRLNTRNVE